MIFITSDTHFGHANIIKYCARPYETVGQMDIDLIRRWNERVAPDDTVYHLGDFAFCSSNETKSILKMLNGHKVLVLGNHDRSKSTMKLLGFDEVVTTTYVTHRELVIQLIHIPFMEDKFEGMQPNPAVKLPLVFCGHVHDKWITKEAGDIFFINAGVDVRNFEPKTVSELLVDTPEKFL